MPWAKRADGRSSAAFWSVIAFGAASVVLSYSLSLLVPVFGPAWGVESHPGDAQGVLYPIVNDGRENCALGSLVFLFYFSISAFQRLRPRTTPTGE